MAQATHAAFDTQREIDSRPALSRPRASVAGKVVGRSLDDADRRRLAQEVIDDLARVPAGKA